MARKPRKSEPQGGARAPDWVPWLVLLVTVLGVGAPFLGTGWHTDEIPMDWDHFFFGAEMSRRAWVSSAPYLSWIPWACGGMISTRTYLYRMFGPDTLLALAVGTVPGMKLAYLLWQAAGALGMYRLASRLVPNASKPVALTAGLIFGLQGFFLNHLRVGHLLYGIWALIPWFVESFIARNVARTAFFLAFSVVIVEMHVASHLAFHAVVLGIVLLAHDPRSLWRFLLPSAALAFALCLGILVPLAENVLPLNLEHYEASHSIFAIYRYLTSAQLEIWACDSSDCYFEYGDYIGHAATLLGLGGLVYATVRLRRELVHRYWIVSSVVLAILVVGPFARWAPWVWLQYVPVFKNFHLPPRLLADLVMYLMVGWTLAVSRLPPRWLQWAAIAASVVPVLLFASESYRLPAHGSIYADLRGHEKEIPLRMETGDAKSHSYPALSERAAISSCHGGFTFKATPSIQPGKGLLLSSPTGSELGWDGVAWTLTAGRAAGTREWVLNQNFHQQLRATSAEPGARAEVFDANGLLGVRLVGPAHENARVRVAIEPTPLQRSTQFLSLGTWFCFVAVTGARRFGRRKSGG